MTKKLIYWYELANDYTMFRLSEKPDLSEMDSVTNEFGTFYGYDLEDEGPIYYVSEYDDLENQTAPWFE